MKNSFVVSFSSIFVVVGEECHPVLLGAADFYVFKISSPSVMSHVSFRISSLQCATPKKGMLRH
jgi:hypothetical protein